MRRLRTAVALTALVGLVAFTAPAQGAAIGRLGFRKVVYIDNQLAGSEGFVTYSPVSHRLIYTTHEGTTLLYRGGLTGSPSGTVAFTGNYRNQVNLWTSADTGKTWQRLNFHGTGFFTNPAVNTGFSDPDLTTDAAGTVYGAGIDLANDALFSSRDGGLTWPRGTVECHEGDRPWLAGGRAGEVFLATDSYTQGHIVVRSTNYGASCGTEASVAEGTGFYGYGKIFLDAHDGSLLEPAIIGNGLGIIELPHAEKAFDSGNPPAFTPHIAVKSTTVNSFWKAVLAVDKAGTIYLVWTTDARKAGTTGGCGGAATPVANALLMVSSRDGGHTWSSPRVIAHPGTTVLWPWVIAGSAGNVNVAWYQYNQVVDLDCAPAAAAMSVRDASLTGLAGNAVEQQDVNVVGRPIHYGQVCNDGTTCVVTGQDRRLGEFFTIAADQRGCVMVATGDTTRTDPLTGGPLPTSRGLFTLQDSGRSLTGQNCALNASSETPPKTVRPVTVAPTRHSTSPSRPTAARGRTLASTGLERPWPWLGLASLLTGVALIRRRRAERIL